MDYDPTIPVIYFVAQTIPDLAILRLSSFPLLVTRNEGKEGGPCVLNPRRSSDKHFA